MSAAEQLDEVRAEPAPVDVAAAAGAEDRRRRFSTRFLRSELRLVFLRRRNLAGMAVLATPPLLIGIVTYLARPGPGEGPPFLSDITSNGLFVALTALTVELPLFLPLAVSAIASDMVAAEANLGTLRYLLAVPVQRTRLLAVKFAAAVIFTFAATLLVAGVGIGIGLALFGGGEATLLSGSQAGFAEAVWRVLLVCGYIAACLVAVAAIGLFVSTLTEQPVGATIAVMIVVVGSQILGTVPQLAPIHPYLFTNYWLAYADLLRDPIATEQVTRGLATSGAYALFFCALAWARFSGRDVTS
jgi:ABC-2 type transport system permease protein